MGEVDPTGDGGGESDSGRVRVGGGGGVEGGGTFS